MFTMDADDTIKDTTSTKIQKTRLHGYEQKVRTKGPTQILRCNGGCERYDESTTKATDTCLTTITNDTMKDGGTMKDGQEARRSNTLQRRMRTKANDTC
jgi:hypothetical protein